MLLTRAQLKVNKSIIFSSSLLYLITGYFTIYFCTVYIIIILFIVRVTPCILAITLKDVRSSLQEGKFCDSKWLDLGDQLGLHHNTLKTIEDDYPGVSRRLRETLVKWLAGADGVSPSWGSLVQALEAIEEKIVAEHISE